MSRQPPQSYLYKVKNGMQKEKVLDALESVVSDDVIPALSQNEMESIKENLTEIIYLQYITNGSVNSLR